MAWQNLHRMATIYSFLLISFGGAASAQTPAPGSSDSLASAAREAMQGFQAVQPQEVAKSKARLADAISQLDRFLKSGAASKQTGWKRYLQWNDLVGLLQQDAPSADVMATLIGKLRAEHTGLELKHFTNLRDGLVRYSAETKASTDSSLKDEYNKRVGELINQLDAYAKDPANGDAAISIGRTIGWLDVNQQATPLVSAVRKAYGQPNFLGYASRDFAAAGIEDTIDRVQGVRDNILGTDLHGTARLRGQTTLVMDENPAAASMRILLGANIASNNVGYNGPVTIFSTGHTRVSAQKRLVMTPDGLSGYTAQASACTNSNINDICAKCRLIERIAWKKAGQQKGQAEAIGSQHAASRVAGQMDRESSRLIAEQNAKYKTNFVDPLVRRGEFPEEMAFSSHSDRAEVRIRQESAGLLAAPGSAPEVALTHDLALRMHESAASNFGEGILAGYELTDLRLEKLIRDDLQGELTDELRVTMPDGKLDPDKEPWSITFAKELPVRTKFSGGGFWIAIRADGFTRGEGDKPGTYKPALNELIEISAAYTIQKSDKGATARRDGDIKIRFPSRTNPDQITIRDSATVTFMRRKFRSMFKEEFVGEGLKFKGRLEKAGTLTLQELKSEAAWLTLAWQMPAKVTQPEAPGVAAEE